jgi:hypothetical protein
VDGESLTEELNLLVIRVDLVCPVLSEVVKLAAILVDGMVPMLQAEELNQLVVHESHQ